MKRLILISTFFLMPFILYGQGGFRVFVLPDTNQSFLSDMSANGKYIVGQFGERLSDGYVRPFLWHADTDSFTYFDGNSVQLIAVSDNGMVAGNAGGPSAFRWTPEFGFLDLGDLGLGAVEISNDGSVIVGVGINEEGWGYPFRWSESGGIEDMGFMTEIRHGHQTQAVSGNGVVVIGWAMVEVESEIGGTYATTEGFKWDGGYTRLGFLDSNLGHLFSKAWGVSFDGSTIVGESIGDCIDDGSVCRSKAVVWKNGEPPMPLPMLNGYETSIALAVTGDGSRVIGAMGFHSTGSEAVIWESDGTVRFIRDIIENDYGIDLSEWYPTTFIATHISDDGKVIMGRGRKLSDEQQGWIMNLEPPVAWTNSGGGVFDVGPNWLGGIPPNEEQDALFDEQYYSSGLAKPLSVSSEPVKITFDAAAVTSGLYVRNSQIEFDLQEHSYNIKKLSIGKSSTDFPYESQLKIINGALGTTQEGVRNLTIGGLGTRGEMIVGSGGIFEYNPSRVGIFYIGTDTCGVGDCGRLIIQDGGIVYTNANKNGFTAIGSNGAEGSVFITGTDSQWYDHYLLSVGSNGKGLLDLNNNGTFYGNNVWVGEGEGAEGMLNATGTDAGFVIQRLVVGLLGRGELNLSEGAGAFSGKTDLGSQRGGNGEITVRDSSFIFFTSDTLTIGGQGSGGLSILNGGKVGSVAARMPAAPGGIGSVLIDGENSQWIVEGTLWMGHAGVGFARVNNGGVLRANRINAGPLASLDNSGGTVYIGGNQIPPQSAVVSLRTSVTGLTGSEGIIVADTLLISEGAELLTETVVFEEGGYFGGNGSFSFDVTNRGGINPGDTLHAPGTLTVNADYTQMPNGTLFIELGGDLPGTGHDQLIVTGTAHLAGTLDVTVLTDFEPQIGQSFEILTAENITGTFDEIITNRDLGVDVIYNPASVLITVTSPVSVDENIYLLPTEYSLLQNYPNPFNPSTTIRYSIPEQIHVTLIVYDVLGRKAATLVDDMLPAGSYTQMFDASRLVSGMYIYQLRAGNFVETKRLMLLK
jgi:T5SS/PEP-CTERM-associated repeat protein